MRGRAWQTGESGDTASSVHSKALATQIRVFHGSEVTFGCFWNPYMYTVNLTLSNWQSHKSPESAKCFRSDSSIILSKKVSENVFNSPPMFVRPTISWSHQQVPSATCHIAPSGTRPTIVLPFLVFARFLPQKNLPRLKTGVSGNRFLDTGNENGSAYSQKRKWELSIAFPIFGNGIENSIPVFWKRESDVANSLFPGINGSRKSMKIPFQ